MNTTRLDRAPKIKQSRKRDYVFVLEDYELAFQKDQLDQIVADWNNGDSIKVLSKRFKRREEEIFLGIFDQALKNKNVRPWR